MDNINADFLNQDYDLEQKYSKDLGSINTLINNWKLVIIFFPIFNVIIMNSSCTCRYHNKINKHK